MCQLYIDFNCYNYRKLSRPMLRHSTGQKDTIHNIFLSNYPVEIVSTFCADPAHWRIYNNKRLIKHALFIPRVNSNVLAKQIRAIPGKNTWRGKKALFLPQPPMELNFHRHRPPMYSERLIYQLPIELNKIWVLIQNVRYQYREFQSKSNV